MKPKISIKFDQNEYGVYYSGQVVSGKVEISFSRTKKVRGIAIQITGYAKTNWKGRYRSFDGEERKTRRRRAHFSGLEDYVSAMTYLVGSDTATPIDILPGIHTYNFACAIPSFAPSSFEGTYGHIRYTAKVILDRPWKFDQTYTVGFTVLKSVDLNYDSPLIRIPAEVEVIKKTWCGLCSSNPLHLRVKIPQTGFVPGQIIPIRTEVNNGTSLKVTHIKFYLRKIISYRVDTPKTDYKEETIDLLCTPSGHVAPKSSINFTEGLMIPAVPPTSQFHSKIIQINYDVKIEAVVPGFHHNPFVVCPITIGTIPLMNSSVQPMSSATVIEINEPQVQAPASLPVIAPVYNREPSTPNDNIPPPTYQESIMMMRARMDEGEEHSLQRTDFVPRYPVYNFDNPSAPQEFEIAEDVQAGKYR